MVKRRRGGAAQLIDRAREAAKRLTGALAEALRGRAAEPALIPARQPTQKELRRYARSRRVY